MFDVASCNLRRLKQQEIFILKNILIAFIPYSYVNGDKLPFTLSGKQDQINTDILKQQILHNNYCQQHDHAEVLSLLNHFHFESFWSHIIQVYVFVYVLVKLALFILFLLSSAVMFFLHCMLKTLTYEKTFCEIDESIASQDNLLSDVIFLGVYSESISLLWSIFLSRKLCFLQSPCLSLIAEPISLDTSGKPTVGFFFKNTSPS